MSNPRVGDFLDLCLDYFRNDVPYLWGGRGMFQWRPEGRVKLARRAYDCSGLVLDCLRQVHHPVDLYNTNTDTMWQQWQPIDEPQPGDVCFYGGRSANDVSHVSIYVCESIIIEAAGGGSEIQTIADAIEVGARVRKRRHYRYRQDFRGFRQNPLRSGPNS